MLDFVSNVSVEYRIRQDCVRVAVVRYADSADVSIALPTHSSDASLTGAIQSLTVIGGGSNLATAMVVLRTQVRVTCCTGCARD